ncbi:ABC transporter ATP-binding protein [Streptomyces sp. ISL-11]|uniref:ABC transporter ATP-binding protein n=1 Tax=Streptomyces sp. ISL-11 TaxID=2819174 RepID=UPI001BED334E|nr:ABC transporter ATP-binding protein [Streptomyces sp. ISL-11]MBT2382535.1 ABC transporter ATP-binding protein [Streptomyces sp. ISL-11]
MSDVLISADRVTKRYGAFSAVDTVSMAVRPGEIVGLLGANGAGKTTLIRILLGLTVPTEGAVAAFGRTPDRTTRGRLGYVPQGLGLWQTLTVAENISFASAAFEAGPPVLEPALAAVEHRFVGEIGLGLQRRLAFTIALAHHPELLVLDEPTSGVDPLSRARLWDAVHDQAEHGTGVLVTTHYMQEAQQCDRLVLMSHGHAVAAGTEADIIGGTTACEVETPHWADAFAALDAAGLPVTLNGRRVRLADTPPDTVRTALTTAGITAEVHEVPATLEEKMTVIDRRPTPG